MKLLYPLALPLTLFATSIALPAQEEGNANAMAELMKPALENKKFDVLLGSWQASGIALEKPGADEMKWTCTSTARRVLGGHFVQEDMIVELDGIPAPMVMRSYYGYDREGKRYVTIGASNDGTVIAGEMEVLGDNTFVNTVKLKLQGQTVYDRWVTKFKGKDGYTLTGYRAIGSGKEFIHVKGEYKRKAAIVNASTSRKKVRFETASAFVPVPKPMAKLTPMVGTYKMTGSMIPAPGAPTMEIGATETVTPIFSNALLLFEVKGDPSGGIAYHGINLMAWDPDNDCYKMIWVNNMGEVGSSHSRLVDGKMISMWSGMRYGQPTVTRSLVKLADDGSIQSVKAHSIMGTGDPVQSFTGKFTKQK